MQQKLYYKQTTRPGALKSLNMEGMMKKWGGGELLKRAVNGMLPKNRLRKPRLARLKGEFPKMRCELDIWVLTFSRGIVFEGELHPYKQNIIRFDGRIRRKEPEVKTEILKKRSI